MRDKRIRAVLALAGAVLFVSSPALRAETFPGHPLRLIVPYAAGGGTDAVARLVRPVASDPGVGPKPTATGPAGECAVGVPSDPPPP